MTPSDTVSKTCWVEEGRPIGHLPNDNRPKGLVADAFGEDVVAGKVQVGTARLGTVIVEALEQEAQRDRRRTDQVLELGP